MLLGKLSLDEGIDRLGRRSWCQGLKSPVLQTNIDCRSPIRLILGPKSTGVDPLLDRGDFSSGERLIVRRHPYIFIRLHNSLIEERFCGIPGNDGRPGFSALEGMRFGVEPEIGLVLLCPVTLNATILEQRTNLRIEIDGERRGGDGEQKNEENFHSIYKSSFAFNSARQQATSPCLAIKA